MVDMGSAALQERARVKHHGRRRERRGRPRCPQRELGLSVGGQPMRVGFRRMLDRVLQPKFLL